MRPQETQFLARLVAEYEASKGTPREASALRRVEAQQARIATIQRGPTGEKATWRA